jgi:putative nucleotidyltransferase with HDIG domain
MAPDADALVHDRAAAWALLTEWTSSEALIRHALAVEASVRAYARKLGEDEAAWGNVALLHDFDYERHPTLDQHPQDGAPVLREHGYPEWFVRAIQSHGNHTGVPRESPLEHTLYACDEVSGFVHACGLVRPDGIATLEVRSVRKKLKQASFARGVDRDDVVHGAQELGVDLDEHIAFVIAALRPIAGELGLRG